MVQQLKAADWLTFDEKRTAMGYDAKMGAYDFSYVSQGLIPLEQTMMDLTVPNDNDSDNRWTDMGNGNAAFPEDTNWENLHYWAANEKWGEA